MLVNFRFKNCRSFHEEADLSLEATSDKQYGDLNAFSAGESMYPKNGRLLKSALIFGGNASGKSNVLKALSYMQLCVFSSGSQNLSSIGGNETFAFDEGAKDEESLYEVDFIENGRFYRYGFKIEKGIIKEEWLRTRGEKGRLNNVFERTNENVKAAHGNVESLVSLSGKTLFLSFGSNLKLPGVDVYLVDALNWFSKLFVVFDDFSQGLDIYERGNGKYRKKALEILALSDIGIKDMKVIKNKIGDIGASTNWSTNRRKGQVAKIGQELFDIDLETVFDVLDSAGEKRGEKRVRLFKDDGFLSEGTEHLLSFLGILLYVLDEGGVVFLDEIDAKLHFFVADYLIGMFNSISENPKNAQLVTTAHNVMLMDGDIRRDQIYFVSKDEKGSSVLSSLSDYRDVRKNSLYSKRYLAGLYADLPNMHHY